jgi:tetratricopeptide (TPR) repeat protein
MSERRVVLILDAWDKAGSAFADFEILRMLLRHKSDWPASHVIVGIRHPEQNVIRSSDKAYEYAWALERESAVAKVYELHEMNLDSPEERVRMLTDIRSEVHGARLLSDEELTKRIDGFPGAISRLKEDGFNINTAEECKNVLLAAHDLRYPEFDRLFEATTNEQKKLAARLAYFPRVSNRQWQLVRPILLAELPETSIHALIDTQILDDVSFPTYGHDARHTAARRWFVQNIPRLIRDEGSKLVRALASGLSGPNGPDLSLVGALAACSEAARETDSDSITLRLIELAHIALGRTDDSARRIEDINYQEILEDNPSTTALVSLSLLSSGNTSYQAGDTVGAIANFDLVITLPNAPVISFGPALYNRGVARALRGDTEAALADFSTVIALPNVPTDVLAMAHYNRGIAKGLGRDSVGAIEDYNTVVRLPNAPIEVVAMAVVKRGLQRVAVGDSASALADFNYVITLAGASPEQVATALVKRGIMKVSVGDSVGALADFESVIALPKAPAYLVASALHNRGTTKSSSGDPAGAIADFDTVILLPGAPADLVAQALFNRGAARGARGDLTGEIADYTAVVAMTNASVDSVAMALCNRGIAKGWSGDLTGEIADYTAVIELPNAPPQPVAKALYNRAIAKSKGRDIQGAIADCSAVITLPNAPTEQVAKALLHRGLARASGNDGAGGLSDFDAVIALPNAPTEVVSKAHLLRGLAMREQGRV